jgi:hypothetical protein
MATDPFGPNSLANGHAYFAELLEILDWACRSTATTRVTLKGQDHFQFVVQWAIEEPLLLQRILREQAYVWVGADGWVGE